jgi:hypothetical protein
MNQDLILPTTPEGGIEKIRVETALSRFPIHALTRKNVDIELKNVGRAIKWEVSYNSKHGQPSGLAYKIDTLIVSKKIQEQKIPIPELLKIGTVQEICKELGINDKSGSNASNVKTALLQNAGAMIQAKVSYKTKEGTEREIEIADTRYGVVFTGEILPDGRKADAVYLILHKFFLEVLNFAQTRPLDYTYMKTLPPMAQRFYEIISYIIYACLYYKNVSCKMRYSEFCKLSTATRYFDFNQVKKQMYKIHRPHITSGYLKSGITYQEATDEENKVDWWIFYVPGDNADKQYEDFTATPKKRLTTSEFQKGQTFFPFLDEIPSVPETEATLPSQTPIKILKNGQEGTQTTEGVQDPSPATLNLKNRLVEAGMGRGEALTQATINPEECERQLEYLPFAEIKTTAGAFLASAIKGGFAPPKAYLEAKTKEQEADKKRRIQEAQVMRAKAEETARQAREQAVDTEISLLELEEPEEYAEFESFVLAEREAEAKKTARFGEAVQRRSLESFSRPEKRRELYLLWKGGRNTSMNTP